MVDHQPLPFIGVVNHQHRARSDVEAGLLKNLSRTCRTRGLCAFYDTSWQLPMVSVGWFHHQQAPRGVPDNGGSGHDLLRKLSQPCFGHSMLLSDAIAGRIDVEECVFDSSVCTGTCSANKLGRVRGVPSAPEHRENTGTPDQLHSRHANIKLGCGNSAALHCRRCSALLERLFLTP